MVRGETGSESGEEVLMCTVRSEIVGVSERNEVVFSCFLQESGL